MRPQLGPAKSSTSQAGPAGNAMALVEGPCSNTIMGEFLVVGGGGAIQECIHVMMQSGRAREDIEGIIRVL